MGQVRTLSPTHNISVYIVFEYIINRNHLKKILFLCFVCCVLLLCCCCCSWVPSLFIFVCVCFITVVVVHGFIPPLYYCVFLLCLCSVNLGVLICIECSGAHRSLGVYVSQVRSLTLDSLKPSSVRNLRSIGNIKANAVYEALLPADFDKSSLRKPGGGRMDFIIGKYVTMKYATAEDKERILEESECEADW